MNEEKEKPTNTENTEKNIHSLPYVQSVIVNQQVYTQYQLYLIIYIGRSLRKLMTLRYNYVVDV